MPVSNIKLVKIHFISKQLQIQKMFRNCKLKVDFFYIFYRFPSWWNILYKTEAISANIMINPNIYQISMSISHPLSKLQPHWMKNNKNIDKWLPPVVLFFLCISGLRPQLILLYTLYRHCSVLQFCLHSKQIKSTCSKQNYSREKILATVNIGLTGSFFQYFGPNHMRMKHSL